MKLRMDQEAAPLCMATMDDVSQIVVCRGQGGGIQEFWRPYAGTCGV